jgi:hypothetical protein
VENVDSLKSDSEGSSADDLKVEFMEQVIAADLEAGGDLYQLAMKPLSVGSN